MGPATIRLGKVSTTSFMPTEKYQFYVEVSPDEFGSLSRKYGTYNIDWYYTETGKIKYFDGEAWKYA